jgi:NTE family protein
VGIGWQSGLIAGFVQGGVDLGRADFVLGTSAGSFVGARLVLGGETAALAEPFLADRPEAIGAGGPKPDLTELLAMIAEAQAGTGNPAAARAKIGAYARASKTMAEDDYLRLFGRAFAELPQDAWPERPFACTAVDAQDGSFQLWTRQSRVGLPRAVASSCSVPGVFPPVTLDGRQYMDGGIRSVTNADLAAGYDIVVVVAVVATVLQDEVESLQHGGATVVTVTPDEASMIAFGPNLMDDSRRAEAARAGLAQGKLQAGVLKEFWE